MTPLIDSYLEHNNLKVIQGEKDSPSVFTPFMLIDAQYLIYTASIAPIELRHLLKRYRNEWNKAQQAFNKEFFRAFNDEQQTYIVDKMDEFSKYINNALTIFKCSVHSRFMEYDISIRQIIADVLACNVLAQSAQIIYKAIHRRENAHIKAIEFHSQQFLSEYGKGRIRKAETVDLQKFKPLIDSINVLSKEIAKFAL